MCVICPVVAGTFILGSLVVKAVKHITAPPEQPKPMPVAVYGEDLED